MTASWECDLEEMVSKDFVLDNLIHLHSISFSVYLMEGNETRDKMEDWTEIQLVWTETM